MRVQNIRSVCIVFMILLMISHFSISSCRPIHTSRSEETKKTDETEFNSSFSSAKATEPEGSNQYKIGASYGVSFREVPGGPNPLHN